VRSIGEIRSDLAWTLDFGGRQKALIDRARSSADAAALDVAAGRLTLAASIAQTYIGIARADAQIAIARDFVASREQSLRLVRARIANRLASDFEARAAETLLAQARQAEVRARGDRALTVHALAALVGRGADFYAAVTPPTLRLDTALPMPEALPSDLLGRRPDILAARARIDAARAGRRIAAAAFMPNVDLRAFVGLSAIGLGSLFSGSALTYGAGPAVHLPLFEGGRLRADYAAATAQADVAIADYNETVLRAVREAADGLAAIDTARADAAEQRSIVAGLQDVLRLDHIRVASGLASQLDILASGDRLLAARQAAIDIDAEGARRRVQLLVALGGGFSAPAETSPIAPVTQARP